MEEIFLKVLYNLSSSLPVYSHTNSQTVDV